jgi:DNA-binding transcriptional regulator WhiA
VRVQFPPAALCTEEYVKVNVVDEQVYEAFIVGIALGDGNLSNPNGRAIRLRITCDVRYPKIIDEITTALKYVFHDNKIGHTLRKDGCTDISLYSNKLADLIPWEAGKGTKYDQQTHVPKWVFRKASATKACLRGLILSDGSIYKDRGYTMVNFCSNIEPLAQDVLLLAQKLGFIGTISITAQPSGKPKYTVRFAKNSLELVQILDIKKKA